MPPEDDIEAGEAVEILYAAESVIKLFRMGRVTFNDPYSLAALQRLGRILEGETYARVRDAMVRRFHQIGKE